MLTKLVNFFKGTIVVKITSGQCEQILNILHRRGVRFWKLRRLDEQSFSLKIFEKDFKVAKTICDRYAAEIVIMKHKSVQLIYKKYSRRFGLIIGFAVVFILTAVSSCFVWDVKVSGCDEKTTKAEILRQFNDLGLGAGAFRFNLDISGIENDFLLKNDDVFWVSVNMRFTTAYIELREKTGREIEIYDLTSPCDIYAARDGQIISMITTSGTPLVKVGDSVCAGDKLVSREYIDRYGKSIIVHSMATVNAKTRRMIESKVPLYENIHLPSGKNKSFFTLNLFNLKIPLYFKEKISYNSYDINEKKSVLKIGNFALPISVDKKTYIDVQISKTEIPYEKAKLLALAELEKKEKEQLFRAEITSKTVKEKTENNTLILSAEYECIEDIAYTVGG